NSSLYIFYTSQLVLTLQISKEINALVYCFSVLACTFVVYSLFKDLVNSGAKKTSLAADACPVSFGDCKGRHFFLIRKLFRKIFQLFFAVIFCYL
ncbi:MAG: hypothetical protein IJU27_06260, partial [Bacteroidales bacterium]|nr:hypothetical protein [Bacteroidales bacterium]